MIRSHQKSFHRLFIIADVLLVAVAFVLAYFVRFSVIGVGKGVHYLPLSDYLGYLIYIIAGYFVIFITGGLYNSKRSVSMVRQIASVVRSNVFGAVYVLALLYLFKEINIARTFIAVFAVINTVLDILFRAVLYSILRTLRRNGRNLKHVLLVGYSRTAEAYIDSISSNPEWGYSVWGILDDGLESGSKYKSVPVVGKISELSEILENNDFDELVIALKVEEYTRLSDIVTIGERYGLHTRFAPDFKNIVSGSAEMEDMDGVPVINIRKVPLQSLGNRMVKRTEDVILGIVALILALIPMAVIAIAVKLSSKGPVIFKQERVGLHNRNFTMYKFRSMLVQDAEEEKEKWTTENDPRVTKVGRFIRRTSLDELPQLFNVLKGDMSLVGPRPERPKFVEKFRDEIPRYMVKHQVRPGITGWAQVTGYRGDTNIPRRIEADLWYIENWSIGLDILILFKTLFKTKDYNAY